MVASMGPKAVPRKLSTVRKIRLPIFRNLLQTQRNIKKNPMESEGRKC
jgi:hypothetical protein